MVSPLVIRHDGTSAARRGLSGAMRGLQASVSKISSGERLRSASDDAASLAVSVGLEKSARSLHQAMENANDGVSILSTVESTFASLIDRVQRLRELAVQAANDSLGKQERLLLSVEGKTLIKDFDRVAKSAEYNGIKLMDGTAGKSGKVLFQVGEHAGQDNVIKVGLTEVSAIDLGLGFFSVLDRASASNSIKLTDKVLGGLSQRRSRIGTYINRLGEVSKHLDLRVEKLRSANSQVRDTDLAAESAEMQRAQVLSQVALSVQAQAHAMSGMALQLLR